MQNSTAMNASPLGHNLPPSDAEILKQSLQDKNERVLDTAQKLVEASERVPSEINNDEQAEKCTAFIKQIMSSQKALEGLRVSEKEPYLTLGRVVDGFFKNVTDRLDTAKNKAKRPLDDYLKRKVAEERRVREEAAAEQRRIAEEQMKAAAALEKQGHVDVAGTALEMATITEIGAERLDKLAMAKPSEMAKARSDDGALASLRTVWVGEVVDPAKLDLETLRPHIPLDALQKAINSYVRAGGRDLVGAKIYEKSETVVR